MRARWGRHRQAVSCGRLRVRRPVHVAHDRWFVEDESLDQLGPLDRHREADASSVRPAHQRHRFEPVDRDEVPEIVGVSVDREVPAVVGPRGGAEIALRRREDASALPDALRVRCPDAVIGVRAVHEHDWRAAPSVEVGAFERSGCCRDHDGSEMRRCSLRARVVSRSSTNTEQETVAVSPSMVMTRARKVMSPSTGTGARNSSCTEVVL